MAHGPLFFSPTQFNKRVEAVHVVNVFSFHCNNKLAIASLKWLEIHVYFILTRTLKFYLHHIILNQLAKVFEVTL